jgi:hypothetical protein
LTEGSGERKGPGGSFESAAKKILRLQDDDFLDGPEALVEDLRLFDGRARLGLSELQQPVAQDEINKSIATGQIVFPCLRFCGVPPVRALAECCGPTLAERIHGNAGRHSRASASHKVFLADPRR